MASTRVFVKGLPPNITDSEMRRHFSAQNYEVTDIKLIKERRIGYLGFKTPDDATKAVKYFNRSYIRMSRIGVEIARPIADAASSKGKYGPRSAASHKSSEQKPSRDEDETSLKKRKRDDLDDSDPRLREFLQVMRHGGEGMLEDTMIGPVGRDKLEPNDVVISDNESDNDYEQLPTARGPQVSKDVGRSHKSGSTGQAEGTIDVETTALSAGLPEIEPQRDGSGLNATDGDWLRSKTNRLLDIVDPLPPKPNPVLNETADHTDGNEEKQPDTTGETTHDTSPSGAEEPRQHETDTTIDAIRRTSRLFLRNLPYSTTEDDIRGGFTRFGPIQEIHVASNAAGSSKGFGMILFADPSDAVEAFQSMDGSTFQGRLLHIIPANARRELGLDEFEISKLPLKKQNLIRKKMDAASNTFNWNSLYMNQDAVNTSVANRLGVSKSELLDPTSADAAVKQAIAETSVIQETKAYFAANGVDLDAFKSHKRGDVSILVKNFPHGTTIEELRKLFEDFGPVLKVLMPPSGTIAIVQFSQADHAKKAFGKLAYRRIRDTVLFLEKAPKDLFRTAPSNNGAIIVDQQAAHQKLSVNDLLSRGDKAEQEVEVTSLFVRNLNFTTTTSRLAEAFESLDGFVSARVKTKMDAKKPGQTLSMGFGFVEFRSKSQAQAALKVMDGYALDGHALTVKASHKGLDAAEERRREEKAKKAAGQRTKIVIKNLPFQATKKDVRALFGTYGQLRSIRVPKKVDYTSRGFAFADFITPREAENALNALRDTHLLGRRLILDFAEAEAVDPEEEIEKMQRKVGGQVNRVALQQLTGGGRKKVNIGNNEEELEG